jgi:exonuclease SbcD
MKFIHLGDLHLGRRVNEFDLLEDQRFILNQILEIIDSNNIDAALLAGDIYDKSTPREEAVALLDYFLNELVARDVKTFIISGNHDSDERLNFGSSLFERSGVFIFSKYNGKLQKQILKDEYGNINIFMMPFIKSSLVKEIYKDEEINTYNDAVKVVLKNTEINKAERNIILAHQYVSGKSSDPDLGGSESLAVKCVGTIEKINSESFDDFDYVALGHIHSPQGLERDTIRYSGSPLKYSLSEVANTKSVPIITLGEKGNVDVDLIELKPLRDMRHLKGRLNQLLDSHNIIGQDDFIYVTLTDEEVMLDPAKTIRTYYPNLMKVDFENSRTKKAEEVDLKPISQIKSFKEIISDFYKQKYNTDISEEELKIMLETAREVGVEDEAY